jgi:hypothetical protein
MTRRPCPCESRPTGTMTPALTTNIPRLLESRTHGHILKHHKGENHLRRHRFHCSCLVSPAIFLSTSLSFSGPTHLRRRSSSSKDSKANYTSTRLSDTANMAPVTVHTSSAINTNFPPVTFPSSPSSAAARYTPSGADSQANSSSNSPSPYSTQSNAAANSYNSRLEPTASLSAGQSIRDSSTPATTPMHSPFSSPYLRPMQRNSPSPLQIPKNALTSLDGSPPRHTIVLTQSPKPNVRPPPIQSPSVYDNAIYTPSRSISQASMTSMSTTTQYTYSHHTPHNSQTHSQLLPPIQDLSHPPGYKQDDRASFADKPIEDCQEPTYRATLSPRSSKSGKGMGILDLDWTFGSADDEPVTTTPTSTTSEAVVKTAITWAKAAGRKISMTEKQLRKAINGEDEER